MMPADVLEMVAFERSSPTSYAACGLPYLVGGLVNTPDRLVVRTPEPHRAKGIDVRIRHEAIAIDCAARTVTARNLDTGRETVEHYDELLISTGASGVTPPWPGIGAGAAGGINIAGVQAAFGGVLGTAITRFQGVEIARTGLTEREAGAVGAAWTSPTRRRSRPSGIQCCWPQARPHPGSEPGIPTPRPA